jgi:hypothetical protein
MVCAMGKDCVNINYGGNGPCVEIKTKRHVRCMC